MKGLWEREKGEEEREEREIWFLIPEEVEVWNQAC